MNSFRAVATTIVTVAFGAGSGGVFAQDVFQNEHQRVQNSALHQAAIASSGNLNLSKRVNATNIYPDIAALMQASDEVLLVHIVRNTCQLAPSGTDPITIYDAQVIQTIKHGIPNETIFISVPVGAVTFDATARATASYQGFKPLSDGNRYVVFLRAPRGQERSLTPGRRLAGDAVQGAFLLTDEDQVEPSFRDDAIWTIVWHMPVSKFLSMLQTLATAQINNENRR